MAAPIETGTMAPPLQYQSDTLNHVGVVAGRCDELGIAELIDRVIVQDRDQRTVSVGTGVKAMILNGLGFVNRALYLTPHCFEGKPLDRLWGPGIQAEHLNDDGLGRHLDEVYEYGVNKLYPLLAVQAVQRLGLECRFGHLDTTRFHTDGQYHSEAEPEAGVVQITGMRQYSDIHDYKIDVKGNAIVIYTADQDTDEFSNRLKGWNSVIGETKIREFFALSVTYSPMLQLTLEDKERRLFSVQRYCFLGSIDDWIHIGQGELATLVKTYLKHLGKESYFELF